MTNKDLADIMFPNVKHDIKYYEELYPERDLDEGAVVSRFAPSPTGFVHMGSLLSAFIERKVPKDTNGVFYLRIEDTDQKRSVENGINGIIEDLRNFDIEIDEGVISEDQEIGEYGPYIQSKRKEIYETFAYYLVSNGYAYPCFCSEEDLTNMRHIQELNKERIGYYGKYAKCRDLPIPLMIERIKNGEDYVVRFKSNGDYNNKTIVHDLVRGDIEFPENDLDVVIIKSDGLPLYHFAHIVDDHLMRTTHVLRGEEWLSSTPVHIQLFKAFGFKAPKYAHLGLVMKIDENGNKRKLSKRKDPEAAVSYYHQKGIPVEAVKLYLLTIANSNFEEWLNVNPDKTIDDFKFNFKKMSESGSLFDVEKLNNISKNYLSKLKKEEVYQNLLEWASEFDQEFYDLLRKYPKDSIDFINIERERKKPRKDFSSYSEVKDTMWYMYDELWNKRKEIDKSKVDVNILKKYIDSCYNELDDMNTWYERIKDLADQVGYAREVKDYKENPSLYKGHVGDICEMIRYAVTSCTMTPSLYDIMQILGKARIEKRIKELEN